MTLPNWSAKRLVQQSKISHLHLLCKMLPFVMTSYKCDINAIIGKHINFIAAKFYWQIIMFYRENEMIS